MARIVGNVPVLFAYNRYSYVYNNPLRYTDPSGYSADLDALWNLVDNVNFNVAITAINFIVGFVGEDPPPPNYWELVGPETAIGPSRADDHSVASDRQAMPSQRPIHTTWEGVTRMALENSGRANSLDRAVQRTVLGGRSIRRRADFVRSTAGNLSTNRMMRIHRMWEQNIGGLIYAESGEQWVGVFTDSGGWLRRTVGHTTRYHYPNSIDWEYHETGFGVIVGDGSLQTPNGQFDLKDVEAAYINLNSKVDLDALQIGSEYREFNEALGAPVYIDTNEGVYRLHEGACTVVQGSAAHGCN